MKVYCNYFRTTEYQPATLLSYDRNKYCTIQLDGSDELHEVKSGYLSRSPDKYVGLGKHLYSVPTGDDIKWTRQQQTNGRKQFVNRCNQRSYQVVAYNETKRPHATQQTYDGKMWYSIQKFKTLDAAVKAFVAETKYHPTSSVHLSFESMFSSGPILVDNNNGGLVYVSSASLEFQRAIEKRLNTLFKNKNDFSFFNIR